MVVVGRTLEEACINAVQLEQNAKVILMASAVGKIKPTPDSAGESYRSIVTEKVPNEWTYLEQRVKRGERWAKI